MPQISINEKLASSSRSRGHEGAHPHGLQFFLTRSVWMLSGAALLLLICSLALLIYSAWRYVDRIEPVQQHLQYLTKLEVVEGQVRTQLINHIQSETAYLNPIDEDELRTALDALRSSSAHLEPSTPSTLDYAYKQYVQFNGENQFVLEESLYALRGTLNQELVAHQSLMGAFQSDAQRSWQLAVSLAIGLLVISASLWTMVRQRILIPLHKLADQMTLLSRRDYSELPVENADPMLYPMIDKYNRMAMRLRELEEIQQLRQETLTEEVRSVTHMLLQQQHRLAQAERLGAVGELAAGIAHELRNPLTSVHMALENLRHDVDGADLTGRVDLITDEVKRVTRQLNQLLDQARLRPETPVLVDIGEEIENLVSLAAYQLHENISIQFEAEPVTCMLPRSRLRQALLNLILNAGQILDDSTGDIMVQARRQGGMLKLTVADSGPGFPADMLETGVQPFRSLRTGGTGLGLIMVRRFASDLGGELQLSNRPQGGACVTLLLPCNQVNG